MFSTFKPKYLSNNFTIKNNTVIINNYISIKPYIINPLLKNKYFGTDMTFNDFLAYVITSYVPESVILNCLKNIPERGFRDISQDYEMIDIYFYKGYFDNDKLLELHKQKNLVFTSKISVSKRILLKYSKTYITFHNHDKFLNEVWFINIPCNDCVANCIYESFISADSGKSNKIDMNNLLVLTDFMDYYKILDYMDVEHW